MTTRTAEIRSGTVMSVAPVFYSQFGQTAYRQRTGAWLMSYPTHYEEFIRKAATGIAELLRSARELRAVARRLIQDGFAPARAIEDDKPGRGQAEAGAEPSARVRVLLDAYNRFRDRLDGCRGYVHPEIGARFARATNNAAFESVGVRVNADGTMALDESRFADRLSADAEGVLRTIAGSEGLAAALVLEVDRMYDRSASRLLDPRTHALQQFSAYQSTAHASWQLPSAGLILNRVL
ncbi:hypothetical protein ACF3MZ_16460 [Paenibacillaceae bacterium WGS1546]|uniref:hypothetical protein n=1 Tax=Cohnella sp. WGS1546 TaxID=3366810 RepID=UPI00372D1AB5